MKKYCLVVKIYKYSGTVCQSHSVISLTYWNFPSINYQILINTRFVLCEIFSVSVDMNVPANKTRYV